MLIKPLSSPTNIGALLLTTSFVGGCGTSAISTISKVSKVGKFSTEGEIRTFLVGDVGIIVDGS